MAAGFIDLKDRGIIVGGGRAPFRLDATQNRLDPRGELSGAEGLGDVIVRPDFEAHDPVDLVGSGGQKNDRDGIALSDFFAKFHSIDIRKSDIQDDEVDGLAFEEGHNLAARCMPEGFETVGFEGIADVVHNGRFVFDNEYLRFFHIIQSKSARRIFCVSHCSHRISSISDASYG